MIKHVVLDRLYPEVFLTRSNSRIFSDFSGGGGGGILHKKYFCNFFVIFSPRNDDFLKNSVKITPLSW